MSRNTPIEQLDLINEICDGFEDQLLRGESPAIETALTDVDETTYPVLLTELLRLELFYLIEQGETPDISSYYERFPDACDQVTLAFDATADERRSNSHPRPAIHPIQRQPGEQIGSYTIEKKLGTGTFADVYLAYDAKHRRAVAIKVMKATSAAASHPKWVANFEEEAQTLSTLSHPHLAQVYETGTDQHGLPFVVMEYFKGDTLQFLLREKLIDAVAGVKLLIKIAELLAFVHQQDIYHRDLKPANILIGLDGQPRIVDFGLAIQESVQHEHAGEIAGSIAYMSPEQLRGRSHRLDGRSDIWALGVMLYEVLTGRLPFKGETHRKLAQDILHRDPRPLRQFNDNVTTGLESLCLKALEKDSRRRNKTAGDFAEELQFELFEFSAPFEDSGVYTSDTASRAELRLAAQARIWSEQPENQRLPTARQYLEILYLTSIRTWTVTESKLMRAAAWYHVRRFVVLLAIAIAFAAWWIRGVQKERKRNAKVHQMVTVAVENLMSADRENFPHLARGLEPQIKIAIAPAISLLKNAVSERNNLKIQNGLIWLLNDKHALASLQDQQKSEIKLMLQNIMREDAPFCDGMQHYLTPLGTELVQQIDLAKGSVKGRTVVCSQLFDDDWERLSRRLDKFGYRPWCRQSYSLDGEKYLAASWLRNNELPHWELASFPSISTNSSDFDIVDEPNPDYFGDFPGLYEIQIKVAKNVPSNPFRFRQQLKFGQKRLDRDVGSAQFLIARASHHLGDVTESIHRLGQLSNNPDFNTKSYVAELRAMAYARNGDQESAETELALYRRFKGKTARDQFAIARLQAKVLSCFDSADQITRILESSLAKWQSPYDQLLVAAVYSAAARNNSDDQQVSARYLSRAVELVREAFRSDPKRVRGSFIKLADLAEVREAIGLEELTGDGSVAIYDGKWNFDDVHRTAALSSHKKLIRLLHENSGQQQLVSISATKLPDETSPRFASVWQEETLDQTSIANQRTRIALAATALAILDQDHQHTLFQLLHSDRDPTLRTELIQTIGILDVDIDALLLRNLDRYEDHPNIQQAILLAIGQCSDEEIRQHHFRLLRTLHRVEKRNLNAGVYSAIQWLRNHIEDVAVHADAVPGATSAIAPDKPWVKNRIGQTLIHVRKPNHNGHNVDCYIAATEVTGALIQDLSPLLSFSVADSSENAAVGLSFYQAAEICNALSKVSGLPESQWCFVPNRDGQYAEGMKIKSNFYELAGYRLPTQQEWICAYRGGTSTRWFCGNDAEKVRHYGWHYPTKSSQFVGQLMPNAYGFFDMAGNALEWTMDSEQLEVRDTTSFYLCGGCSWFDAANAEANDVQEMSVIHGDYHNYAGMRIATSIRPNVHHKD